MRESPDARRIAATAIVRGRAATSRVRIRRLISTLLGPVLLLLAVSASGQSASQCREANDQAIAALRSTLPDMSEQDRAAAETLIDELEHLVKERRAEGADECVIWQEITRRVWRS
jgi:hypothetical protein